MNETNDFTATFGFNVQIFNSIQQAIIVTDKNAKVILWNDFAEKLYGYTKSEAIGKTTLELISPIEQISSGKDVVAEISGGKILVSEYIVKNKAGRIFPVSSSASPIYNANNEIIGIVGTSHDISEKKEIEKRLIEREEKYRSLFEVAQDAIFVADADTGILVDVNQYGEQLIGYNRNEIIGQHFTFLHPANDLVNHTKNFEEAINAKGQLFENMNFVHKDGHLIPIEGNSGGTVKLGDRTLHFSIFRDISKRKNAEIEIIKTKDKAKASENKFRAIVEYSHNAICIVDESAKIIWNNERMITLSGYTEEEILQADSFVQFLASESIAFVINNFTKFVQGVPYEHHYYFRIIRKDGEKRLFEKYMTDYVDNEGQRRLIINMLDITEKATADEELKIAKQKIEESEEKYRLLVDNMNELVCELDEQGKYIYLNNNYKEILGYEPSDLVGRLAVEHFHPDDIKTSLEKYEEIVDNQTKAVDIWRFKHKNGEYRIVECKGRVYVNSKNQTRTVVISRDITEQKQAELELLHAKEEAEQSEQKYRLIAESTSDGILVIDANTQIQYVSPAYLKQIGYEENEVLTANSDAIYAVIHPDDRDVLFANIYRAIEEKRNELIYSYRVLHKNGQYYWREDHAKFNYDSNGNYINTYVICRDITERKEALEKIQKIGQHYQSLIEKAPDGIVLLNAEAMFTFVSPSARKMFGFSESDDIKMNPAECTHPDDLPMVLAELAQLIENPSHIPTLQYRYADKNGNWKWVETTFSNLLTDPNVESIVLNFRDITAQKRAEIELIRAKDKAEESDRLKSAFLQNMSHEVRTPLNAIAGFSYLLTKTNQPIEKIRRFSDLITSSSDKLIEIITDVIEISQIQANLVLVKNSIFNFISLVAEITQEIKSKIDTKNIEFIYDTDFTDSEYYISADEEKIRKIFKHLIDNAVKFTRQGHVKLELSIDSQRIEFIVCDTGIGISKEMQQKVFEPFRQMEVGICRNFGGNGLGLAIVKAYVEMLNGTITLQSEPNVGTTIAVILPATQVMKNELFHRNLKPHKYAASTILIVEDEYGNYLYINELLSETKARILYAADGQEAIDICRNEAQIDLVLMDIKMPVVDGYTATKLIKAFRSDLIIIAQTAYATDSDKEVFLECGFDGYICKPIQEDNLFAAINKYLIS